MTQSRFFADQVAGLGVKEGDPITVVLSNDLVRLLSTQLYQSPLKAIEELVVNSFDAAASVCKVYVPSPSESTRDAILVYDDGQGMTYEGLRDLWQIGRSNKRDVEVEKRTGRKQIGKFGIGKLATYTIAHRLTYVSRTGDTILTVTIDFRDFTAQSAPIPLTVSRIADWSRLKSDPSVRTLLEKAGLDMDQLLGGDGRRSWTLAILEDLKPAADQIRIGRLGWVLSTAMPLIPEFALFLNGSEIKSSKQRIVPVVEFTLGELPRERLTAISRGTGEDWHIEAGDLKSRSFPSGIRGRVMVTGNETLGGKSEDLRRSYGFFVRVRDRLINEDDALFGLEPKSYKYFNRFRADIHADDLDSVLTAPREGVEESALKRKFQTVINEVFNEARQRRDDWEDDREEQNKRAKEHVRNYVNPRLVEHPLADTLALHGPMASRAEATNQWFYLDVPEDVDVDALVRHLYEETLASAPRRQYEYHYAGLGNSTRLVRFNPGNGVFTLNLDHDLVREHFDDGRSKRLLEDVATAEALLEVYLVENRVPGDIIGEILERRDTLLRSLAQDRPYSLRTIAQRLRDASGDQYDLEVALVAAARAVGFVATHVSGEGEPDGVARFVDYPDGEQKIILEAKSSGKIPSLSAIDFGGLQQHMRDHDAIGCLLVARDYPGATRGEWSAAARRARNLQISCWRVETLADFVEAAEARHLNARDVLAIVQTRFTPGRVERAVQDLLAERKFDGRELYRAVLRSLREMEGYAYRTVRSVDMIVGRLIGQAGFESLNEENISRAVRDLAAASHGAMTLTRDGKLVIHTAFEELERRLAGLTKESGAPLKPSWFRRTGNERGNRELD
jgi:Histidine kinase-, DNA gyrase B-, and HSP90-like ATPase